MNGKFGKRRREAAAARGLWIRCAVFFAGLVFFALMAASAARGGEYPHADRGEEFAFPAEDEYDVMSADDHHMAMRMSRINVSKRPLYGRRRASRVNDSITIVVQESTSSTLESSNDLKRDSSNNMVLSSWLVPSTNGGLTLKQKGTASGEAGAKTPTIDYSTSRAHKSDSTIDRAQSLNSTLTGIVLDVRPNGHLVVEARKTVGVNGEVQTVTVTGTVNPAHLDANNAVKAELIMDMKVQYFGSGPMTRMDQRGWGAKIIDFVNPF